MKNTAILSIPMPTELREDIILATKETELSAAEVMRRSIRFGLPRLRRAFAVPADIRTKAKRTK